jgi:hypothetical protein
MKHVRAIKIVVISTVFLLAVVLAAGSIYVYNSPKYTEAGKLWAISLSAIIFDINDDRQDTLSGFVYPNYIKSESVRNLLERSWNINNKRDLFRSLEYLKYSGQTRTFFRLKHILTLETELTFEEIVDKYQLSRNHYNRMLHIYENWDLYSDIQFVSWDWGRYVSVVRWGYGAGYLDEDEAYDLIVPVASLVQNRYSSWEEFGQEYVLGRMLFGAGVENLDAYYKSSINSYKKMISPGGVWDKLLWNTQLYTDQYILIYNIENGIKKSWQKLRGFIKNIGENSDEPVNA